MTNDPTFKTKVQELLQSEEDIKNFQVITHSEVHYTGKENIEGFASLVSMFMRSMLITSKKPCLINVDNTEDNIEKLKMEDGLLFYYSTLQFKDSFTTLLSQKVKNLETINVKTSFSNIAPDGGLISVGGAVRLCAATFNYIGLRDTIYVWNDN